MKNASITTLCARLFYDAETDSPIFTYASKLFDDLLRAGVEWHLAATPTGRAMACVIDAGGERHVYIDDYAIIALAGAAEMASGRRVHPKDENNIEFSIWVPKSME